MSYEFYKVLHLGGVFMVLMSLSSITLHVMNGGSKNFPFKKLVGITHGIGLLISFVAGFGLVARLGSGFAPWIYTKMIIWLVFGGLSAVIYRKPSLAKALWFGILILAVTATFLARYKPF